MLDKQSQKGGDASTNIQADSITLNLGIDEKRAREICREMNEQLKKEYSLEALETMRHRVSEFEDRLVFKMEKVEGALGAFADPGFQLLLLEAQKKAASTERYSDYDLLSELLIHRFEKGENRPVRAGISRAVDVVDEISDEALLGLGVIHAISYYIPSSGDVSEGLDTLESLFGKINYGALPQGNDWLDHLDVLDAIRLNSFLGSGVKKIQQYYPEVMSGYVDVGIEKGSKAHDDALEILKLNNLPSDIFVDHFFNDNFLRLRVVNRAEIKNIRLSMSVAGFGEAFYVPVPISASQIQALESIYDLYKVDQNIRLENVNLFMVEWNKRQNLRTVGAWWDNISVGFHITSVGKVLADCNIRRFDGSIPPVM